ATGNLLKSPWEFRPGGQSGTQVSDLFPEVRKRVDDLCVIRSVHADNSAHGGSKETLKTREMYGIGDGKPTDNFGRQCLTARRLAEAGVRFIQCTHSYKWGQHDNLMKDHTKNAPEVDRPIAALLADLKQRDLLKDTLVWWGGEFGRTPAAQGGDGRDHN